MTTNPNTPPDADPDPFDSAVFYSCGEPERLYCTDPKQAIWDYLDQLKPNQTNAVTVKAYAHMKVSLPGHVVDWMEESVYETYTETDHADPDGEEIPLSDEHRKRFVSLLQKAVDYFCEHIEGWACEVVAERTYSGEELERIKKELYLDD